MCTNLSCQREVRAVRCASASNLRFDLCAFSTSASPSSQRSPCLSGGSLSGGCCYGCSVLGRCKGVRAVLPPDSGRLATVGANYAASAVDMSPSSRAQLPYCMACTGSALLHLRTVPITPGAICQATLNALTKKKHACTAILPDSHRAGRTGTLRGMDGGVREARGSLANKQQHAAQKYPP